MQEIINSIKLSLIIALCIMLLALVEIAPEKPVLFLSLSSAYLIVIRFLWKSAARGQNATHHAIITIKNKPGKKPGRTNCAA